MSTTTTVVADPPRKKLNLRAYGGTIEDVQEVPSFALNTRIEVLRQRLEEDGVLWVKGLIDRDLVNKCRREYLDFVNQRTHILKNGTNPEERIFSGDDWKNFVLPGAVRIAIGLEDEGRFVENAVKSHIALFYLDFKENAGKQMEPFVGKLMNFEDCWCFPHSLLRSFVPGAESTPVH